MYEKPWWKLGEGRHAELESGDPCLGGPALSGRFGTLCGLLYVASSATLLLWMACK